jgi:hypothetical protein
MSGTMRVKTSSHFLRIFGFFRFSIVFLSVISVFSFPAFVRAQSLPFPQRTLWGSSSYALGGAAAATFSGMDFFSLNPAGISYFKGKSATGGHYSHLAGDLSSWSLAAVDGISPVNAGVQIKWTDFGESTRHQYQLAIAYPTSYGTFGVGLHSEKFKGLTGAGNGWHLTSSAGVIVNAGESLAFGASVQSLLDKESDSLYPPTLRLGASFLYPGAFRIAFDAIRRFKMADQNWNYSTGLEAFWEEWIGLTAGYHFNHSDEASFWTTGVFLRAPRIDIGATYQQEARSSSTRGFTTEVTLKF